MSAQSASSFAPFRIRVPDEVKPKDGTLVAIFTGPARSAPTVVGVPADDSAVEVTPATTAYLQLRREDGSREDFSTRARMATLQRLADLTIFDLLSPTSEANQLNLLQAGTELLGWFEVPSVLAELTAASSLLAYDAEFFQELPDDTVLNELLSIAQRYPGSGIHDVLTFLSWLIDLCVLCATNHSVSEALDQLAQRQAPGPLCQQLQAAGITASDPQAALEMLIDGLPTPTPAQPDMREFASLDEFLELDELASGKLRVNHQGLPIDMDARVVTGAPLVVMLHGRKSPQLQLPYLSGAGITAHLPVSRLSISDPSLYLDPECLIAWFAGNHLQPKLQQDLTAIITKVQEVTRAPRVVFVGGSGGGFASLYFAHAIPGARAVVWNPQTDIFQYYGGFWKQYVDSCWNGDRNSIPASACTSVVDLYRSGVPADSTVLYLQQTSDTHHVDSHLAPFLEATKDCAGLLCKLQDWSEGHVPPPKEVISESLLCAALPEVREVASSLGFVR